jgi:hypothetical protein
VTDLRGEKRQHGGRPAPWRACVAAGRRAPVFAAGVLPLGAVCVAFIAVLSSIASRPGGDGVLPPPHQGQAQPSVLLPRRPAPTPQSHRSAPRRTRTPTATSATPSLRIAESSRPPDPAPRPGPQPASPPPRPTPSPPAPAPAPPADPPVTASEQPAPAEAAPSASPPSAPPTSAAPPVTQPASTPGWGCGDDNHEHTGAPGKADADSPCDRGDGRP